MVAISAAILSSGDSDSGEHGTEVADPIAVRRITRAFGDDPPLLLYAVLKQHALQDANDAFVSTTELACSLVATAREDFAAGEWILAAPEITKQHQHRWSRLMAQSRSADPEQWIGDAAQWLQVLGGLPDSDWLDGLPAIFWDHESDQSGEREGSVLLQQLARARGRELVAQSSLSALAEKRKLAAAKQLAYGLSHEINNPLANISARAQQLARDEADPERAHSLDQIVQQVYRAHEMIAGLMFFANPPEPNPQRVDLNQLVISAAEEFQPIAEQVDIRLLHETVDGAAEVDVDPAMMLEAIRVLLRNAIEAVGTGGTVVVSLDRQTEQDGSAYWVIHVTDSGPGLSVEASRHAFDPFYSGREAGRGLGLGLCRAYRVAKLHHATVRVSAGLAGCVATIAIPSRD